ncbi:MAG: 50S ribosomal protein L24 [Nitrospinota bacterium]
MVRAAHGERKPKYSVKRGDIVEVIAGKGKGKRGKVLLVLREEGRVVVEKVNFIKRHTRPSARTQQGGILEREGKIHISNVMPVDPKTSHPTRVARKRLEDGRAVRVARRSGEQLDTL